MWNSIFTRAGNDKRQLREQVLSELGWDARVAPTKISVSVRDDVVKLAGVVESFPQKCAAEEAALRVRNVRAVANELEVRLSSSLTRTDGEITAAAAHALAWDASLHSDEVAVSVSNGCVTLTGEVEWHFQKVDVEGVVRRLAGVKSVSNQLVVKPRVLPNEVEEQIEDALVRTVKISASSIDVDLEGTTVILKGRVCSHREREEAERVAWLAPGASAVDNRLVVKPVI